MPVANTSSGQLSILQWEPAGQEPANIGILLEDPLSNRLYLRLRRDWDDLAPEEADVLSELETDLSVKASELGAEALLTHLEDTLSNTLRVSDRRPVMVENFDRALARLYREHVRPQVNQFVTHIPRYSLAAAAGKFLDNSELTEEGWEEAPGSLRVTENMFAAEIVGRSMEPRIPDGSVCVFRYGVTGSRQGRLVLVEALGRGSNDRYTVKRYHSSKKQLPDGTWTHEVIRMEPLNPEFETWELDASEDNYRIIAEFVEVLF